MNEFGSAACMFITPDGRALASTSRHPEFKQEEFESSAAGSIQQVVMTGQPGADLIYVGGHFLDAVSIPSSIGGHLVGVLTFGVEMGEPVAQEFKKLTSAEVIFVANDRVAASTLKVALPPVSELTGALAKSAGASRLGPDSIREIVLGGEHFFGTTGRLATVDSGKNLGYILLSSCEQHLGTLRATQSRLGFIGLLAIALSTFTLGMMIRSATRPLHQLREAAERLGHGDYSRRVAVTSGDECGVLAKVFNQMTENLNTSRTQLQQAHDGLELRVEERTAELREEINRRERAEQAITHSMGLLSATLESTADGILTIGPDGRIESFNQTFVEMWRILAPVLAARNDEDALQFVLDQVKEPELFLQKIRHVYDNSSDESFDTLDFNDGR